MLLLVIVSPKTCIKRKLYLLGGFPWPGLGRQAHRVHIRCILFGRIQLSFQAVECRVLWLDKQRYMRRSVCIFF